MIIIPICLSANVVGYVVSTKFDEHYFKINKIIIINVLRETFRKFLEKNYNYYPIKMLTKREIEAMQLLAYGYTVKEIAETMNISEHTVKDYIQSAIKKQKLLTDYMPL